MNDEPRRGTNRGTMTGAPTPTGTGGMAPVPAEVLQHVLTPRGLFTNLLPVVLSDGPLGPVVAAPTAKVTKAEMEERRRPRFYQSSRQATLYAYGDGVDDFRDPRFSRAILRPTSDVGFTLHLLRNGLADAFSGRGFLLSRHHHGFSVLDHGSVIRSAKSGFLHIVPEFTFQPQAVDGAGGATVFAFAIEPSWVTAPLFTIGAKLKSHPEALRYLKVRVADDRCRPGCPLHGKAKTVVGVFDGFADADAPLDCQCLADEFVPVPVRVRDRRAHRERVLVVPGQRLVPAERQRKVLRLFSDRPELERSGRVWLGDLTKEGRVRSGALQVRYERIQQFLARVVGNPTAGLEFTLPTGGPAVVTRVPLTVDLVSRA